MPQPLSPARRRSTWSRYRDKHKWQRVAEFPRGIEPPRKVRIYSQNGYFRLQWWDPRDRRKMTDRVDGDLVSAISRARVIDEQLLHFRTGGQRPPCSHEKLYHGFCADLGSRADSGQLASSTPTRYESALQHYLRFVAQPSVSKSFPSATQVDREFALQFQVFLANALVAPNGHQNARKRPISSPDFVLDVVRAMFEWAADLDRGNLMPSGFRNPFLRKKSRPTTGTRDLFGEPDISVNMAAEFLGACDAFQLPLFAVLVVCGLRASEPCLIFREHVTVEGWLKVPCLPQLGYLTKGRLDKRFPLPAVLLETIQPTRLKDSCGLLFTRRAVWDGSESVNARLNSFAKVTEAFDNDCQKGMSASVLQRERLRHRLLREAGKIEYDHIASEFRRVSRRLNWPIKATLKDFRHLFSTELMNAGVPDDYRRYLLGHSVPNTALACYTHLNELKKWFDHAMSDRFTPILNAISSRSKDLRL